MAYTKAIIDLEAIRYNFRLAEKLADKKNTGRKVMAVIKGDAYGHGALATARALEEEADFFATALFEEAWELRQAGIDRPILILGAIPPQEYLPAAENHVSIAFYDQNQVPALADLALPAKVHIKINTGMERLGFAPNEENLNYLLELVQKRKIQVEGIFSHLSQATGEDPQFTEKQIRLFDAFTAAWTEKSGDRPLRHLANSAAIFAYPKAHYDMVRAGIMLYGGSPLSKTTPETAQLQQAMTLTSAISQIHTVPAGAEVGYDGTYIAKGPRRIATVPVGYADGYKRILSNRSSVLIAGKRAPQVGNVCMDQIMVDITSLPQAKTGDEVVLFGRQKDALISADEMAAWAETISYEIFTSIGKRVKRVYTE